MTVDAPVPGSAIPLESLPNFRDLGGYATSGDGRVARGRLYRSVMLARLTEPDSRVLEELGLRSVFDLRTAAERESSPDRAIGAREVHLDVLADDSGNGPASLIAKTGDPAAIAAALDGGKGAEMMKQAYRDLILLPSALSSFRAFFTDLATSDTLPALFHCTTGKDRTGWAAASTLLFLGVSEKDVFHDYLQTNEQLLPALQPMMDQFASAGGNPDSLRPVLGVDREYLQTALDMVAEKYGSIDAYMSQGLGLNDETLVSLRSQLLVG